MLVSGIKGAAMDSVGRIWRKIRGLGIGVLLATGALWHSGTVAAEYLVSFETDTDTSGGSELAFVTYSSYADLLADNNSVTTLSPINVAAPFSTTGQIEIAHRLGPLRQEVEQAFLVVLRDDAGTNLEYQSPSRFRLASRLACSLASTSSAGLDTPVRW